MSQPDTQSVVIACPQCGTRYALPYSSIGRAGRTVQCAHCGHSWTAKAKPPAAEPAGAVSAQAEAGLDRRFAEEEQRIRETEPADAAPDGPAAGAKQQAAALAADLAGDLAEAINTPASARTLAHQRTIDDMKAAIGGKAADASPSDEATMARRQRDFSRRQAVFNQRLPMARLRRSARIVAFALFVIVAGGGIAFRAALVTQFPQLAGAYAAIGLGVNVVGLEFRNVQTLKALQQGAEALTVDGSIASVSTHEASVPPVIVTLLDGAGRPLYEWSMMPKANELEPGESVRFETQLTAPPVGASAVRLRFAGGGAQSPAPADAPSISDVQKG